MTDNAELRRLAKRADDLHGTPSLEHVFAITKFREAVEPKAILALLDEIDRLKAENEALRKIISECATACGAGCAPECTLEFMSMLPGEISSVVSRRAAAEIGKSMGGGE